MQMKFEDKDIMNDLLTSQKKLTSDYNTFSSEVVDKNLKQDLMSILREEHEAESMIFEEMESRGWYNISMASQDEISKARQKFSKIDKKYGL